MLGKSKKNQWITLNVFLTVTIYSLLVDFSFANKYLPKSPDDENIVNSEGMWQKESQTLKPPTKLSQGASRFDVGGILTAIGLKQGASIFALVVFPILFPFMVLLGLAMFVISMFGTGALGLPAVAGRRSDTANSLVSSKFGAAGYSQDRYGFPISSLTNRDGHAFDAVENETCVERFVCEILLRGGSNMIGRRNTFQKPDCGSFRDSMSSQSYYIIHLLGGNREKFGAALV